MPDPCCAARPPVRFTLERRRTDFEHDARVTPFTGSCCCCCCCLHWIGAAVGGIVGMNQGWKAAETESGASTAPEAKSALSWGMAAGILVAVGLPVLAAVTKIQSFGVAVGVGYAFLPSLVFLPVGIAMIVASHLVQRNRLAEYRKEASKLPAKDGAGPTVSLYRMKIQTPPKTKGALENFSVFCRHCWADLGESLHLSACPECSAPIDQPLISGPDYGMKIAQRATLSSVGYATAGTFVGYLVMVLIGLLMSAMR